MMRDPQGARAGGAPRDAAAMQRRIVAALTVWIAFGVCVPTISRADAIDDYNLALQLYKQERWEQAAEQLQKFLAAVPNHEKAPLAKLYLGQSLVHRREFAQARPVFRDFVRSYPQHSEIDLAMYRVGECSYFLSDFPTARKELREFLSKVPAEHELTRWALQYLGETELRLGNMRGAADAFERLLSNFKDGPLTEEARFGLARAYDGLDRSEDAIAIYRQLASDPKGGRTADAQFNLAARLFEDKKYADAAAGFLKLIETFPQHELVAKATLNAAFSRYHLEDYAAAIDLFRKLESDAEFGPTARYWTALSLKAQGDYAQAAEILSGMYAEDEKQPLAENLLFHAADSKLRAKEYADAARMFVEVADRFPTGDLADDAVYSAMEAALVTGNFDQAEKLHQRFSQQFPVSGLQLPVDLLYGRLLLARGDELETGDGADDATKEKAKEAYREAAETFRRVMESSQLPQTQALARLQLARTWDRLENYEQLIETLEPLAEAARAEDATDEQVRALFMQSSGYLALKKYDRALETAQQYLQRRPKGDDAAEAWANVAIAQAHRGQWDAVTEAVGQLRAEGEPALASSIAYGVAETAYEAARWETAELLYESIVEQGPQGELYLPSLSGLAYSLHEAGRELLKAAEQASSDGASVGGTAQLSEAISRFDNAARWFGKLSEFAARGDDIRVQSNAAYMQALSLKLARRREQAAAAFLKTAQRFSLPQDGGDATADRLEAAFNAYRAWKEAARTLTELNQIEQADQAYAAAFEELKRQPAEKRGELDVLINEWALLHYNVEAFTRSDELFRLLIEETPQSKWADDARLLLAESDFFADRFEQARDAFQSIADDPASDDFVRKRALLLLVDAAHALEDWTTLAKASQSLREFLQEKSPESPDRWYAAFRIGEAALRQGDAEAAAEDLKRVIDEHARTEVGQTEWFPNVWLMLAEAQLRIKDYDAVEQTVAMFKEQHPESSITYQLDDVLGRRYKNEGRFDEAREAFGRVIESRDGRGTETAAKAQFLIAETYLTQGNALKNEQPERSEKAYNDAFLAYFRVLQYDFPEWRAAALFQAGQCDEVLGRWSGAKKNYQQLISEYPESEHAVRAQKRLDELDRRFPTAAKQ